MEGFVEKIKSITNVQQNQNQHQHQQLSPQSTQQQSNHVLSVNSVTQVNVIPDEVEKINNIASLYTLLGDVMMDKPKDVIIDHIKKLILKAQGM
jgi:chaperonin cofactor prefoldin